METIFQTKKVTEIFGQQKKKKKTETSKSPDTCCIINFELFDLGMLRNFSAQNWLFFVLLKMFFFFFFFFK